VEHLNLGTMIFRAPIHPPASSNAPLTVVATGVGRSGTSMVAKLIDAFGVPMGPTHGLAVFEDQEFNTALVNFDYQRIGRLIEARNASHTRWGFKFASLQNHLFPPQLLWFRNPRLVIVTRDVIATASRSLTSDPEIGAAEEAVRNVTKQATDMMHFAINAPCPVLLISYEKMVAFPDKSVEAIARFCDITLSDELLRQARRTIEPNNTKYIELFHPNHRGNLDGVADGHVVGWCARNDSEDPVEVQLLVDGVVVASGKADVFRQDLLKAGIGNGKHGFRFDISRLRPKEGAVLEVRTADGTHVVFGSGHKLKGVAAR